jgi:hypothetical protein
MVNNLMGARIQVNDFDPLATPPQGKGLLAVYVDKPEMFVGMATMMVPGFEELDFANQTQPVKIPAEILQTDDFDVSALMSKNAIGASVGAQTASGLEPFMQAKAQDSGTFISVSYDLAKQVEIQEAMSQQLGIYSDSDNSEINEMAEALRQSYTSLLGYSRVDMKMTSDGLLVDSRMTFK